MRLYVTLAAAAAAVALAWWTAEALMDAGAQRAISRIETENRSAADAASKARDRRRACSGPDRVWDTATGQCQR